MVLGPNLSIWQAARGGGDSYGPEQTLTLQPTAAAGLDALIQNLPDPNANFGTVGTLTIGERDDTNRTARSVIKFDLSSIPDGSLITSAVLSLYCTVDKSSNARTFRVYRLKRAWVEAEVTWNSYSAGNPWQTAGGFGVNDCEQTDIGNRAFTATETLNENKDFTLVAAVKSDLDLGHGWLLKADTEADDAYSFLSSDSADPSNNPKLVVKYRAPL